jgi:hypothetical protein
MLAVRSAQCKSRPVRASNGTVHARYILKSDVESTDLCLALHIIQAPKREPRMMRCDNYP